MSKRISEDIANAVVNEGEKGPFRQGWTTEMRGLTLRKATTIFPALPTRPVMKTFSAKANEVDRKWWIIDAEDQVLGRVAVKAANLLRGKEKAILTPHVDTGDFVVVINAEKVRVTGKKEEQKKFMSFSGFVGGHKSESVRARRARHPELLVEHAVRGMIPHTKLGRAVYRKLKVYTGAEHPHAAQQPQTVALD
jgi:large subunit ribosomal protein L13